MYFHSVLSETACWKAKRRSVVPIRKKLCTQWPEVDRSEVGKERSGLDCAVSQFSLFNCALEEEILSVNWLRRFISIPPKMKRSTYGCLSFI